jgi:Rap1a immunity proteins
MKYLLALTGLGLGLVLFAPAPGAGAAETTREMLSYCQRSTANPVEDENFCVGYLSGVLDTQTLIKNLGNLRYYCLPSSGVTVNEAQALLESYVARYPSDMDEDFLGTFFLALKERYPC